MNYEIYNVLNPISSEIFESIYALLSSSLPQSEMRSKENQKELLKDKRYNLLVAFKDNKIIGFMAIWTLNEYTFIEHFAVDCLFRGKGLGGRLLDECKAHSAKPIVLEVEPPESTADASRRIEFYKRHGFLFNDYGYCQPPLQDGFAPLPLRIMSYPHALSKNEFTNVKNILYTNIYGIF